MSATWKQGKSTDDWCADYRGLSIQIKADASHQANTINFYIDGRLSESAPVECPVELAKLIAITVIDQRIPEDVDWAAAEEPDRRAQLLRRKPE
jgi:hypothetical protein